MGNGRTLVAMSGGVDSSAAAALLLADGYECVGAMMKLIDGVEVISRERSLCDRILIDSHKIRPSELQSREIHNKPACAKSCCSASDAESARAVCHALGIGFYVFNFVRDFREGVMRPFCEDYLSGRTPNPCLDCNALMKFGKLADRADLLGAERIATGHYARVSRDGSGRFLLLRGIDERKDQSYVLYMLTQPQLARALFPLGGLTKDETRAIARSLNLVTAEKRESQDICFVPDGDHAAFIERFTGAPLTPGVFVDESGRELGGHSGAARFTIGQRKGLRYSAGRRVYVRDVSPETGRVTLSDESALYSRQASVGRLNLIAADVLDGEVRCMAKLRYGQKAAPAAVRQTGPDTAAVEFDEPQRAITPGQAVVFYDGDIVVGGGRVI
jgi:tRNA-specific 2-thiouridylase